MVVTAGCGTHREWRGVPVPEDAMHEMERDAVFPDGAKELNFELVTPDVNQAHDFYEKALSSKWFECPATHT